MPDLPIVSLDDPALKRRIAERMHRDTCDCSEPPTAQHVALAKSAIEEFREHLTLSALEDQP